MNASYDWLRSLVPVALSPVELRDLLTAHCATVDELVPLRDDLKDVVVGRVVEVARHPNSDHLWLTKVDAGTGERIDVVCGAPTVRQGQLYPFAPAGTVLPGGLKLERRKIRGVISNGMLCSARELALGDDQQGIMELEVDAAPGTPLLRALAVGDTRLVIDVMPNRPDLLSHLGLAREVAAITGVGVRLPEPPGGSTAEVPGARRERAAGVAGSARVELRDTAGCPRYTGVVLRGVTVAPSPEWLRARIVAVGGRPINNIVDVTNYMLHEVGQPMHAFDLSKLAGPAVVVRRAAEGERLETLDGMSRRLEPWMTLIADAERPQAIAGVMGGADSEVTDSTTDIFLEVATFDPGSVRRTRRALGLSTDASYRFERGTDIEAPPVALERAVKLLVAVAGGRVDGAPVDLYPAPREGMVLKLRPSRVARVLGDPVPRAEILDLLARVGFDVSDRGEDTLTVRPPSWRVDIALEADLLEEVARLRGYDSFSDELRPFRPTAVPDAPLTVVIHRVREALVAAGLAEARPMPFVKGGQEGFVRVANPIAENEAYLRRDLLDTLARRAEYNMAHEQRNVRLFEVGAAFAPAGGPLPREEMRVAALVTGERRPVHWTDNRPPDFDEWDAKALAETAARAIEPGAAVELAPGSGDVIWEVRVNGVPRGVVRRLTLDAPVWAAQVFGVELTLMEVPATPVAPPGRANYAAGREEARGGARAHHSFRPIPTTPAVRVDIALLVPTDLPAGRVTQRIWSVSGDLLEQLTLFDEFRGGDVPAGYRSLAWRLTYRHPERTLSAKEVAGRREKLLRTLEGELGVRQRSA
jgi:phenylalanyl-tRNA synthetase beta chain